MAKRFRVKKRFENQTQKVVAYLLEDWEPTVASAFLTKLERRMDAVVENPMLGSTTQHYKNLRSLSVTGHNRMFYRVENDIVVFVMLSDTRRRHYKR